MNRTITRLVILLGFVAGVPGLRYTSAYAQTTISPDKNYVITEQIRAPGAKTEQQVRQLPATTDLNQHIIYSDGFGRPTQQISVGSAPGTSKDVVQPYTYGPQGERTRSYLPFTSGSPGQFKDDWEGEQNQFYQWASPKVGRPGDGPTGNGPTYSEVLTDNDPLGRPQQKAAPGEAWKLSGGHTQRQLQRSNSTSTDSDDKVYLWKYTPAAIIEQIGTVSWFVAAERTLAVNQLTDEDGKIAVSFTDERGLLVCRRVYLAIPSGSTAPKYLDTNYIYDDQGNLIATIPPEATRLLLAGATNNSALLGQYAFINQYDNLNRVIASKTPGKRKWSYQVYDRWDRVVATQDANQNARNAWAFVKYDALNRPIITGEIIDSRSQAQLTDLLSTWPPDRRYEKRADNQVGYTYNNTYPEISSSTVADQRVATVKYYDDYAYYPLGSLSNPRPDLAFKREATLVGFPDKSTQTKGMLTGERQRVLSSSYGQWLTTVVYYDEFGRAIQTKSDNHTGTATQPVVDHSSTLYQGLDGRVVQTYLAHKRSNQGVVEQHEVNTYYSYDPKGRLTQLSQKIDNGNSVVLAGYEYNELGQLVDKKLGFDAYEGQWLQSLDYRYNIRGWLTNINNRNLSDGQWLDNSTPNTDPDAQPDVFGLEVKYQEGSQLNNYYNGNISGVIWNSNTPNKGRMRQYSYDYDNANRITKAEYGAYGFNNGDWSWNNEKDASGKGFYTLDGLTYDDNGNIKSLNRNGNKAVVGNTKQYGAIDALSMTYVGNQLMRTRDAVGPTTAPNDFENGWSTDYQYDDNGNLTLDPNKEFYETEYNNLDLLYYATIHDYDYITNYYNTAGEKLRTISQETVNSVTVGKTTDYIAGFTYTTNEPVSFMTPVGRAVQTVAANGSTPARWTQEYHIRDNQGSLRMVLRSTNPIYRRASMELSAAEQEEDQFDNLAATRQFDPEHARTGSYSARLNARQANRLQGPATRLAVMAGDSVKMRVYGRYDVPALAHPGRRAALLTTAIAGSAAAPGLAPEGQTRAKRRLPFVALGTALGLDHLFRAGRRAEEPPRASLTYQLYNKDSVLVATQTHYLDESSSRDWQLLADQFEVKEDGYVEVYLANASGKDVWLDDLAITAYPPNTIQENHYDPFGQNLVDIETSSGTDTPYQYTGQQKVAVAGFYDYNSRNYDYQVGRFMGIDADATSYTDQGPYNYVLNNPILYTDPDGKNPLVIAALVGAGFNILGQAQAGNIRSGWNGVVDVLAYGAIGAAGGAAGYGGTVGVGAISGGGFVGGALAGGAGGYAAGFVTGTGNSLYQGNSFKSAVRSGNNSGMVGAAIGATIGGIAGAWTSGGLLWTRPDPGVLLKLKSFFTRESGSVGVQSLEGGFVDDVSGNLYDGNGNVIRSAHEGGEFIGDGVRSADAPFSNVTFGRADNTVHHTWRHVLKDGFGAQQGSIREAIIQDIRSIPNLTPPLGSAPQPLPLGIRTVYVNGVRFQYSAALFSDWSFNVSSIRTPR